MLFRGPFGDQPFAVLAWQVLGAAAIFGAVRLLRGRVRMTPKPLLAVGRIGSRTLRDYRVLVAIGVALPFLELLTGGYLLTVTYAIELYVMLAVGLNIVVGFTGL